MSKEHAIVGKRLAGHPWLTLAGMGLAGMMLAGSAWAQGNANPQPPNQVASPKFAITSYQVLGNTLLPSQSVVAATQPFTGPQSDFETIQQAVESLEKAYAQVGFGSVKVEVPEQELAAGRVTLQVVESKLGEIKVEENSHFDAANVRRSLPALVAGQTPNTNALNRNIQLANESGSKFTSVTFKRNSVTGDSDAIVRVAAEDPQRWLALLDNSGSDTTGRYRLGLVYQHANLFNRDHAISVQVMSSPGHWSQVGIVGLGYRIPMYDWGGAWDFSASHSTVDSGKVAQAGGGPDLAISGGGNTAGARYTHNLGATDAWQHKISIGLERRQFGNSVAVVGVGGGSLVPDLATSPLTIGYSLSHRAAQRHFSLSLNATRNLPGAANGSTAAFNQPGGRTGASDQFQLFKYSLSYTEPFASQWSLRMALAGQSTGDLLISPEQYGAGGADSVRGFADREIAADQGMRLSFEAQAPAKEIGSWRLSPLAFVEAAHTRRNQPAAGEVPEQNIASAGLGLRAFYGRQALLKLDWGSVQRGVTTISGSRVGDQRLHASLIWIF